MQLVIDNQDAAHNGLLAAPFPTQAFDSADSFCSESVHKSHFGRKLGRRLPSTGNCKHLCQVLICKIAT
jgi:hypothetical protein